MSNIDLSQMVTAEDKAVNHRTQMFAGLASLRWQRETGGIALPDGSQVSTTRESQAQITSAVNSLQNGLIVEPVAWKLASGWADLTAAQVTAVAGAVADHVKRCFAAERAMQVQMEALADLAGFDAETAFDAAYTA